MTRKNSLVVALHRITGGRNEVARGGETWCIAGR
jgi:hypothetical protein